MARVLSVQITDHSAEVLKAMHSQVILGLQAIGQEAEGYAKDECPQSVDTGRLRNSITNKVDKNEQAVYVGTNTEYGQALTLSLTTKRTTTPAKRIFCVMRYKITWNITGRSWRQHWIHNFLAGMKKSFLHFLYTFSTKYSVKYQKPTKSAVKNCVQIVNALCSFADLLNLD